jgi:hypothetical protein
MFDLMMLKVSRGRILALALLALLLAGCVNPKQEAQGLAGQSVLAGVTFNQMLSLNQLREKLGGAELYLKGMDFVVGRSGGLSRRFPVDLSPEQELNQQALWFSELAKRSKASEYEWYFNDFPEAKDASREEFMASDTHKAQALGLIWDHQDIAANLAAAEGDAPVVWAVFLEGEVKEINRVIANLPVAEVYTYPEGSHNFVRPSSWLPKPEFLLAEEAAVSAQSERIFTKNGPQVDPEILGFGEEELYDQFHALLEEVSRERD